MEWIEETVDIQTLHYRGKTNKDIARLKCPRGTYTEPCHSSINQLSVLYNRFLFALTCGFEYGGKRAKYGSTTSKEYFTNIERDAKSLSQYRL